MVRRGRRRLRLLSDLAILPMREDERDEQGAAEGHQHVALGVPGVALHAEPLGALVGIEGDDPAPFEELVGGAEGQGDADGEEAGPARADVGAADEELAGDERGRDALEEMADAVEVVAREMEVVAEVS